MFHVLADNALLQKAWSEPDATKVLCGIDRLRCAISQDKFDSYEKSNKLRTNNICKNCYRRATRN
jgi:hypothetical protein